MSRTPSMLLALAEVDASRPLERDAQGRPSLTVRSRVPFTFSTGAMRDAVVRPGTSSTAPVDTRAEAKGEDCAECEGTGMKGEESCAACGGKGKRAAEEPAARGDGPTAGPRIRGPRIEGIASSTGRDCYGTEMSRACLDGMAAQFRSGSVVYLAKHPSFMGGDGEWDDVMGYVFDGTVERGEVKDNTNPGEFSYILRVGVQLDEKHAKAASLAERVADGHQIGQSIGGWFTRMTFIWPEGTDEDEKWWSVEPDRIVVEEVELDHLAATRRPANVESWIDGVRSALQAHGAKRAEIRARAASAVPPETRAGPQDAAIDALVAPVREAVETILADRAAQSEAGRSEASEVPTLDTSASAGNDTGVPTSGSDAQEALPQERNEPSQEPSMTPEQIAQLAAEAAIRAVTEMEARRAAAAPPAPVPVVEAAPAQRAEDPEVVRLRTENERLRSDLQGALAAPIRRGFVGHFSTERSAVDAEVGALLSTLDTETRGRRLGAVIRSKGFIERRTEADGPAKVTKGSLEGDLRSIIGAACDDGLIRVETIGWA